ERPLLTVVDEWESLLRGAARARLEQVLPGYLAPRRWFAGKARRIRGASIQELLPVSLPSGHAYLCFLQVTYDEGAPETYLLPLAFAAGERAATLARLEATAVVARVRAGAAQEEGVLYDAVFEPAFASALLDAMWRRRRLKGTRGEVAGAMARTYGALWQETGDGAGPAAPGRAGLRPSLLKGEQSNSNVVYGDGLMLKLFRKLEPGVNPDLEVGRFLNRRGFPHTPAVVGYLEYRPQRGESMTVGVLKAYVPNEGDAWQYTLDSLGHAFEHALSWHAEVEQQPLNTRTLLELTQQQRPPAAEEMIGTYLESARLLGCRTAELHLLLAAASDDPAFAPEPFSALYQRSLYQSMRNLSGRAFQLLDRRQGAGPEAARAEAARVLELRGEVLRRFRLVVGRTISALRTRTHGDYHLGQILYTGKDFQVIDFEGEPARPLSERRLKRSPLSDVAGMLRSFHYAAYSALLDREARGLVRPEDAAALEPWARFWYRWVAATFLRAYLVRAAERGFLPGSTEELHTLLDAHLLEKAVYELGYELNNRPAWVVIPIRGILQLVQG
ncbi:MAG: putative maltokinase, partial [Gemmatimonadetes bacterium]|nr:putative maltokinase [Gemmatimonadota bacterium]